MFVGLGKLYIFIEKDLFEKFRAHIYILVSFDNDILNNFPSK